MPVDAFASQRHYAQHLLPIWRALPRDDRGHFWTPTRAWVDGLPGDEWREGTPPRGSGRHLLVASHADSLVGRRAHRPVILTEHGVGQTYVEPHGSYAGGPGRGYVVAFLCPTEAVAQANRATYPGTPCYVVGSPRLDRHYGVVREPASPPVVAVTFHWACEHVPETRSALAHYLPALPALVRDPRWTVLGHAHPRAAATLAPIWRQLGVEYEPDLDRVLEQASCLVADNTSALYESSAVGIPAVVLDAPWYRRDVEHGLRFWRHADVGVRIGDPADLTSAVALALADPPEIRARRAATVAAMWGTLLDGQAASRAAAAIRDILTAGIRGGAA